MYGGVLKRCCDVFVCVVLLVLLSPLLALAALVISIEDGGPPIFRQQRIGRSGVPFTIYKFRSMPVGTPNMPSATAGELRVTRVGRILRRTNIDELPQLWNVLKGDMSLVGPRPALPSQSALLALREAAGVLRLRPGLTGLAQVNAYDGMPETEKVQWEDRYARRVSFGSDLAILLRTFVYLLRRPPSY
jgi:lipopolysaccharide/colanic/teichoic acid biosynthesis glycosyltransferase